MKWYNGKDLSSFEEVDLYHRGICDYCAYNFISTA